MGEADTEMQRWCDEALKVLGSILDASAPVTGASGPAGDGDELREAVHHADRWKAMHPCPNPHLGEELAHLVDAWSAAVGDGARSEGSEAARRLDADQRQRRIKELSDDTVRLQAKVDAELLPGQ
jgi:hypothetical protein